MNRGFRLLVALCATVLLAASETGAGESPQDKAAAGRTKGLLAKCKAFDPSLVGTTWVGIYLRGWRCAGTLRLEVRKGAENAAYEVVVEKRVKGQVVELEELKLDAAFGLLSRQRTEEKDGKKSTVTQQLQADKWECTIDPDGEGGQEPLRSEQKAAGPDHGWDPILYLLCRKIDLKKPGDYLLRGTTWPVPGAAGEEPKGSAGTRAIRITVPPRATWTHRGKTVPGFEIRLEKEGDAAVRLIVDEAGRLLRIGDFAGEKNWMAGTEQEATSNLPAGNEKEGEAGAKAALRLYFLVVAKVEDPDVLDEIVDWPSALEASKENPLVAGMDAKTFAEFTKKFYATARAAFSPREAESIAKMFTAQVQGETATLTAEGLQWDPVTLKRIDGKWKLAKFPG
jgi:hypothetical protein